MLAVSGGGLLPVRCFALSDQASGSQEERSVQRITKLVSMARTLKPALDDLRTNASDSEGRLVSSFPAIWQENIRFTLL